MKVGDYVKIKEGLNYEKIPGFTKEMQKYCGKVAKIVDISKPDYILDIDNEEWYWGGNICLKLFLKNMKSLLTEILLL